MKQNNAEIEKYRNVDLEIKLYGCRGEGNNGIFTISLKNNKSKVLNYLIIVSDGGDWDHVSVSCLSNNITPTWEVMSFVKDLFFEPEETVLQFHPKKSEYVNNAKNCLHLWRPINKEIELPPSILTGIKA